MARFILPGHDVKDVDKSVKNVWELHWLSRVVEEEKISSKRRNYILELEEKQRQWEEKKRTANKKKDCVKKEDNGNSHSGFLKGKKNFLWEENWKGQIGLKLCE